jgi:alpha-tubulin suppressor-like RCC1 family protein
MNKLMVQLLIVVCALLVSTVEPGAAELAQQKGHSPIYSFDVMYKGEVAGEVKINTAKKAPRFVLRADGLTPDTTYMFFYRGASAEDLYLLGYQGTTRSGQLRKHGRFADTSPNDLQQAQFWLTEAGVGNIQPGGHKYIAAGGSHSMAVSCDGDLYVWGSNSNFECGLERNDVLLTVPYLLETLRPGTVEAAAGNMFSMALMSDGTVYAWGNNRVGELGIGNKDTTEMPHQVLGPYGEGYLTGITRLAAGDSHSLAVRDDGSMWAWGDNAYGKLGIGTYDEHHTVPYQVRGPDNAGFLTNVVDAAAGDSHSLALRSDGTVYACGYNLSGQLGSNDLNYYRSPHQVHGPVSGDEPYLTGIVQVAAGANFSLALKSDGTLWAWGEGGHGQLGLHSNNDHSVPYQVHGPENAGVLTDVVDMAAGDHHTLALKSDGTVWAWGEGGSGQLGVHSDNDHTVPYQVHGPGNVGVLCGIIAVAAGDEYSMALRDDGTVWAWGEDEDGQLGINSYQVHTQNDQTVPHQVHGPDNVDFLTGIGPTCGIEDVHK